MTRSALRRALAAAVGGVALLTTTAFVLAGGGAASAEPLNPKIKPDAVINVGQEITIKNDDVLINPLILAGGPEACRGNASSPDQAAAAQACRAYRIKLNRDPSPKASNTVYFRLDFEQTQLPGLPLVAAGLNPPPLNGYDVNVYDQEDHYLGQNEPDPTLDPIFGPGDPNDPSPGGSSFNDPEIGSFIAKTDTYDFVISSQLGIARGFTLRIKLSNELFAPPSEIFENLGQPTGPINEPTGSTYAPPFVGGLGPGLVEPLPLADVLADNDIAGIGLGTTEQFDRAEAVRLGQQALRNISIKANPPSTLALFLGIVAFPLLVAVTAVVLLRRRRQLFAA
jgi:hypothetical protein